MFGFGMAQQKKLIPVVVENQLPVFLNSIEMIFKEAGVPLEKRNAIECAIFVFWSIRLGILNADGATADKYAADYVLESTIKRWIAGLAKASGQRASAASNREFYQLVKQRYAEYHQTIQSIAFRRGRNGNVDLPLTEATIHLFVQRVAMDREALAALSSFGHHFSVALSEGQWACAGLMQPKIVE